ncbi:manganese-dependent inorganic pyrophosphatase [Buttiauxella selenatireducens]|uniref:inorganic diphosphatase n=1 Tax=Buttiauxella selenatireducens TaxID=3073902 RepID=A0ABY9SI49_9ENTR|nr:manganese-dependent inorganic pyrophosphatase [Buttiauxella sp. R73]WMY76101.1 manganese-dependent inorganic pyrophosphatase [Buttiauxella sp. R73]
MIHVIGHLHPDSDSVCTAFMTARWLTLRGQEAQAWRTGEINRETQFIFEHAGLPLPESLSFSLADRAVWLVDFTEPAQGPESLTDSNIVGIIDHHRLGGLITRLPPEVWIKPVGSSATVLWQLMSPSVRDNITPAEAILMLGAVMSDTVDLRSPTTTEDDRTATDELTVFAGIDRSSFVASLLTAKTSIEGMTARQLLNKDIKTFEIDGIRVRVAQLELYSLSQTEQVLDALRREMDQHAIETDVELVVLMLTDINARRSELYFSGAALMNEPQPCVVNGMLSRKKQLLPWLQKHLHQHRGKS